MNYAYVMKSVLYKNPKPNRIPRESHKSYRTENGHYRFINKQFLSLFIILNIPGS